MTQRMNKRPARKTIRLSREAYRKGHACSITIATHLRYPWFRIHYELSNALIGDLESLSIQQDAVIYAWCFMPDHLHLLLHHHNVVDFIRLIKGRMIPIGRRLEPGRKIWHRSFYDHVLRKDEDLTNTARYIWSNPVRAGIVENAKDYGMSGSLFWPDWRQFA